MPSRSAALKKLNPAPKSKEETRQKLDRTTRALYAPAKELASKSRARAYESGKTTKLPSRKPRAVTDKTKDRSFIGVMRLFGVGVVVSLVVIVGIQTLNASRQIKIDDIRSQQRNEITKYRKIRKDIANLKSPTRITRRATFLGMIQPQKFTTVNIPYKSDLRSDSNDDQFYSELKAILNGS